MAKPTPIKSMGQKPMMPKPMMSSQTPQKPAMSRPTETPKGRSCCSGGFYGERLQWILLIGGFVAFLIIVMFQQQTIDSLTARVNKTIEDDDHAIAPIEKRVIQNVIGSEGGEVAAPADKAATGAPQNVGIPGSRLTMAVPGTWSVVPRSGGVNFSDGDRLTVNVTSEQFTGDDLQGWFNALLGTDKNARVTVGPNQVLVGGKLAMDATTETTVVDYDFADTPPAPVTVRITAVRDGGTLTVFRARSQRDVAGAMAAWDSVLKSVSFAQ